MSDDELLDADGACRLIGGADHPINKATLWRGVKAGRYPKPIAVSSNVRRWRRSEIIAALDALAAEREAA